MLRRSPDLGWFATTIMVGLVAGCSGTAPPPPPGPRGPVAEADTASWDVVSPKELEARLVPGKLIPFPSDATRQAMVEQHLVVLKVAVRFCVDESGAVAWSGVATPSGLDSLDRDALATIRGWSFSPDESPACTTIELRYLQQ